jgi:hypothetical protein
VTAPQWTKSAACTSGAIPPSRAFHICLLYVVIFAASFGLWSIPAARTLDLPSWHEFDDAAIARNFYREPSTILYPRIDWRKDGPGFVESEFPLYPWLLSRAYQLWRVNIIYGRILNLGAMLATLFCFTLLARSLLPESGAIVAVLVFAVNRIVNFVATALQPEALMFLFYVVAAYSFLSWRSGRSWTAYVCTILALSLAILEKSPAAHLGIFFLMVLLAEEGWKFVTFPANWALAFTSLLAPALWYAHAYRLWITYGNSLGISNENHWFDWDTLRHASNPAGLVITETVSACAGGALLLVVFALSGWRSRSVRLAGLWYASILVYYVISIRTTGGTWAWYYHIVSIAPVAILAGSAVASVIRQRFLFRYVVAGTVASIALIWVVISAVVKRHPPGETGQLNALLKALSFANYSSLAALGLMIAALLITLAIFRLAGSRDPESAARWTRPFFCAAGIGAYLFISGDLVANDIVAYSKPTPELQSAESLRQLIPPNVLILSSGGICSDGRGHKAAFDNPYMFYWLDRKGFAICATDQSIPNVRSFAARGAQFFVAEKSLVATVPDFESELKENFPLRGDSKAAWLFDLRHTLPKP